MGQYIDLHHVCLGGYSKHYYAKHSFQISLWTQFNNKSTSRCRLRKQKQDLINRGNEHENCNQINQIYKQGDKVLLKYAWKTKFNQDAYIGPYVITTIRNNVTVKGRKCRVTDTLNI